MSSLDNNSDAYRAYCYTCLLQPSLRLLPPTHPPTPSPPQPAAGTALLCCPLSPHTHPASASPLPDPLLPHSPPPPPPPSPGECGVSGAAVAVNGHGRQRAPTHLPPHPAAVTQGSTTPAPSQPGSSTGARRAPALPHHSRSVGGWVGVAVGGWVGVAVLGGGRGERSSV